MGNSLIGRHAHSSRAPLLALKSFLPIPFPKVVVSMNHRVPHDSSELGKVHTLGNDTVNRMIGQWVCAAAKHCQYAL